MLTLFLVLVGSFVWCAGIHGVTLLLITGFSWQKPSDNRIGKVDNTHYLPLA